MSTNGDGPTMEALHNEAVVYRRAIELLQVDGAPKRAPSSWTAVQRKIYRLAAEAEEQAAYRAKDYQRSELLLSAAGFCYAAGEYRRVQSVVRNALKGTVSIDVGEKLNRVSAAAQQQIELERGRLRLMQ